VWPAREFSISLTRSPGRVVLIVRGDLDAATAPRLRDAVVDVVDHDRDRDLVIDIEGVTFIDSSGIYVLIHARKLVHAASRRLTLSGANPGAYKVLDVCGLTSVFDLPTSPGASGQRPEGASGAWR